VRVFVTGGTGFVGRAVVTELLRRGHEVRLLVRSRGRRAPPGVEAVEGDILDLDSLRQGISGCDAVIHLVGIIRERSGSGFEEIHVRGTAHVVETAMQARVGRFLHMSALGTRMGARSRYHRTKWEGEEIVRRAGMPYGIYRPSVIFGPEDEFVNLLARIIRRFPVLFLPGRGTGRIQPVAVEDVAEAFARGLEREDNFVLELGGERVFTLEELCREIMFALSLQRPIVHIPEGLLRPFLALGEALRLPLPLTRDQLIMLSEDNVCDPGPLREFLGRRPRDFATAIRSYLQSP